VSPPTDGCYLRDWISEQDVIAHVLVRQLMHEAGVRTVFQQTPHQISKQIAVPTHRRIDTTLIAFVVDQAFIKPLPHAVEALKLKIAAVPGPFQHSGD
jgi:hypothetical protein